MFRLATQLRRETLPFITCRDNVVLLENMRSCHSNTLLLYSVHLIETCSPNSHYNNSPFTVTWFAVLVLISVVSNARKSLNSSLVQ